MEKVSLEQKCPLCGSDNSCAMAAGKAADNCWCVSATISPETLAAIPAEDTGKRCICAACAQQTGENDSAR